MAEYYSDISSECHVRIIMMTIYFFRVAESIDNVNIFFLLLILLVKTAYLFVFYR